MDDVSAQEENKHPDCRSTWRAPDGKRLIKCQVQIVLIGPPADHDSVTAPAVLLGKPFYFKSSII